MNKITTNRNYYRLSKEGRLPIAVLTNQFSPVLAALLEENLSPDCHYSVQSIISATEFQIPDQYDVQLQVLEPDKFLTSENYLQSLKHNLVDISPEIIALIDFEQEQLGDLPKHFRGRILRYYWQEPVTARKWLSLPLLQKENLTDYQLRIEFINDNPGENFVISYVDLNIDRPPSQSQANSIACQTYTAILDWLGDQRILLDQGIVYFDGKALDKAGMAYAL